MKTSKTILFVMPRFPFPASSGRKNSLYHYCRILSEQMGYRLVVAAFTELGDDIKNKPDFIDKMVVLPKASAVSKLLCIIKNSFVLKKYPMQVSLYWNNEAKKIIDELVVTENPDVVIGDMIRSTEYIRNVDKYKVADLDDRISLRYQRQLDSDINGVNPYGAFLNHLPRILQKVLLMKQVKIFVLKNEIALLKKYELEVGNACDKVVFVAEKEAREFNEELGCNKAIAVPIGVDIDYFSYCPTGNDGNIIGFLGAMNVAHNENAVKHFVSDIFPSIVKSAPDVKLLVIGGGVSEELRQFENEHIEFTGRVDDVRDYLKKCKVFVCPLTFGSGIKTKNLEAMSIGLPVVTSSIGAENIDAEDNVEWMIADDNNEFSEKVIILLKDDSKRKMIGFNGNQFVRKNFTWQVAQECFTALFDSINEVQV